MNIVTKFYKYLISFAYLIIDLFIYVTLFVFLYFRLKNSMSGKVVNEKELQKFEAMMKIFEDARSYDLNCHSSQLRFHFNKYFIRLTFDYVLNVYSSYLI